MLTVIKSLALFFQIIIVFVGCIFLYVDKNTPNLDLISESELQQPIRIYSKDGKLIHDFLIEETSRSFHVCNAPSPAATSSLPIGKYIVELINKKIRKS